MEEKPDILSHLTDMVVESGLQSKGTGKALILASLAPLSLLLDKGIISHEEAIERLRKLREWLKDGQDAHAKFLLDQIIEILQSHAPSSSHQGPRWNPVVHQGGIEDPD